MQMGVFVCVSVCGGVCVLYVCCVCNILKNQNCCHIMYEIEYRADF